MFAILNAVNKLDRALGGTGFAKVSGQQSNGPVTITLAPEQPAGVAERIRQICAHLNQLSPTTDDPSLAGTVRSLQARVA